MQIRRFSCPRSPTAPQRPKSPRPPVGPNGTAPFSGRAPYVRSPLRSQSTNPHLEVTGRTAAIARQMLYQDGKGIVMPYRGKRGVSPIEILRIAKGHLLLAHLSAQKFLGGPVEIPSDPDQHSQMVRTVVAPLIRDFAVQLFDKASNECLPRMRQRIPTDSLGLVAHFQLQGSQSPELPGSRLHSILLGSYYSFLGEPDSFSAAQIDEQIFAFRARLLPDSAIPGILERLKAYLRRQVGEGAEFVETQLREGVYQGVLLECMIPGGHQTPLTQRGCIILSHEQVSDILDTDYQTHVGDLGVPPYSFQLFALPVRDRKSRMLQFSALLVDSVVPEQVVQNFLARVPE